MDHLSWVVRRIIGATLYCYKQLQHCGSVTVADTIPPTPKTPTPYALSFHQLNAIIYRRIKILSSGHGSRRGAGVAEQARLEIA